MNYLNSLLNLNYIIEEYNDKKEFNSIFNQEFFTSFNNLLIDSKKICSENNELSIKNIDDNKTHLLNHYDTINSFGVNLKRDFDHLLITKNHNDNEIHNDLIKKEQNKDSQNKLENKNLNSKFNKLESLKKDLVSKTKDKNKLLDGFKEPIKEEYSKVVSRYSDKKELKINQAVSQISKSEFQFITLSDTLIKHLVSSNNQINDEINKINESINAKNIEIKSTNFLLDSSSNKKIASIKKKYDELKHRNELQANLEISNTREKIKVIEENHQEISKKINKTTSEKMAQIDNNFNQTIKKAEQKLQDANYQKNTRLKFLENEIDLLIKNKNKQEIKHKQANLKKETINFTKLINKLEKDLKNSQNEILKKKYNADLKRRYDLNINNLNEANEKYPYLKKIAIAQEEKKTFYIILNNQQEIEINKEKAKLEKLKLNGESKFMKFNAINQIEISNKVYDSYTKTADKLFLEKIINIIKNHNKDQRDTTSQKFNNFYLLKIEKNKHLSEFNQKKLDYLKNYNDLFLNHYKNHVNIEEIKYSNLSEENKDYNITSLNLYNCIRSNDIKLNTINYKFEKDLSLLENNYKVSKENYLIQVFRKNTDIKLLNNNLQNFSKILLSFNSIFISQFKKLISNINNDNSKLYLSYFNKVINTYKELLFTFNAKSQKILDDHIRLEIDSKYSALFDSIDQNYVQRKNIIVNKINNLKDTVSNYTNGIASFYMEIKNIDIQISNLNTKAKYNKENKNQLNKEIKILNYKSKNYRSKISRNNHSIYQLNKELNNYNKKLIALNKEKIRKSSKLKKFRKKEASLSLITSDNLKEKTNYYLNLINNIIEFVKIKNIFNDSKKILRYYKLVKKTHIKFNFLINNIKSEINHYQLDLNKNLLKIKSSSNHYYSNVKKIINNNYKKEILYIKKAKEKQEKIFYLNFVEHDNKKSQLSLKFKEMHTEENLKYNKLFNDLKDNENNMTNSFFNKFKSCNDLMEETYKKYNKISDELNVKKHIEIKKALTSIQLDKQSHKELKDQTISKFKKEIELLPKYINEKITSSNDYLNTSILDLENKNTLLKESLSKSRKDNERELFNYQKNVLESKKEEFKKFKENLNSYRTREYDL